MRTNIRLLDIDGSKIVEYIEDGHFKFIRPDARDTLSDYDWLPEDIKQECVSNWTDEIVNKQLEYNTIQSEYGFESTYTGELSGS